MPYLSQWKSVQKMGTMGWNARDGVLIEAGASVFSGIFETQ